MSTMCCDIYPPVPELNGDFHKYYLPKAQSIGGGKGKTIYIFANDFNEFWAAFHKIPVDKKVTIAWGLTDTHSPVQIIPPEDLRRFLFDRRLERLFVQNYDLVGCNPVNNLCSDITPAEEAVLRKKVFPIPIGLDLHTMPRLKSLGVNDVQFQSMVCDQRKLLITLHERAVPFDQRKLAIVVSFDCTFSPSDTIRTRGRGEVCTLISQHINSSLLVVPDSWKSVDHRTVYWEAFTQNAFAFAPFGYGLDTHRFWEILQMRAIPIVRTSSMDRL